MTASAVAGIAGTWTDPEENASDSDRALVEAAQEEPHAFAAIYTRYGQRVYLYIRSRVACDDDAVDITQQVFVKAFRALPRYRISEAPLPAWLFRIARNSVVDHQRRHHATVDVDAMPALLHGHGIGPEESVIRMEEAGRLRQALMRLPADKRELLALRYAGGLKIREIAVATGRSEEAVKKQLSRSIDSLRKHYDEIHSPQI